MAAQGLVIPIYPSKRCLHERREGVVKICEYPSYMKFDYLQYCVELCLGQLAARECGCTDDYSFSQYTGQQDPNKLFCETTDGMHQLYQDFTATKSNITF